MTSRRVDDELIVHVSAGSYGVVEFDVRTADDVADHTHDVEEAFFVIHGEMTFRVEGDEVTHGPGSFVRVPRGTVHGFHHGDAGARYLVLSVPGGLEAYFEEVARAGDPAQPERAEIARKHGTRFL